MKPKKGQVMTQKMEKILSQGRQPALGTTVSCERGERGGKSHDDLPKNPEKFTAYFV